MRELFNPLIKSSGTLTDPAAETKSIGLPADALVPHFLLLSGQFYRLKAFIATRKCPAEFTLPTRK